MRLAYISRDRGAVQPQVLSRYIGELSSFLLVLGENFRSTSCCCNPTARNDRLQRRSALPELSCRTFSLTFVRIVIYARPDAVARPPVIINERLLSLTSHQCDDVSHRRVVFLLTPQSQLDESIIASPWATYSNYGSDASSNRGLQIGFLAIASRRNSIDQSRAFSDRASYFSSNAV